VNPAIYQTPGHVFLAGNEPPGQKKC